MFKIGIDIGGTSTRIGLFNNELEMVEYFDKETLGQEKPETTLEEIVDLINVWQKKYQIASIGIGCPGPLDLINGIILTPKNIPAWQGFNIRQYFVANTGIANVKLENDANANGIAQAIVGPGKGAQNCIYITVSTGLGLGIVINGKVYSGSHGFAAEVDRFVVDYELNNEFNVRYGIEGAFSGSGILETALKQNLDVQTTKDVFDMYKVDPTATLIIDYAIKCGTLLIHNLMTCFDPEYIIFGGSVVKHNPFIVEAIKNDVKKYAREEFTKNTKIVLTDLDDGGIIGAALSA